MDARKHPRFAVKFRSSFSSSHMVAGVGTVTDLSVGGCRVATETAVTSGTMLEMRLQLPDGQPVLEIGLATVRWARGGEFGVEFLRLGGDVRERMQLLLDQLSARQTE